MKSDHIKSGMLIVGGAAPVALDAPSHPNHHLIVHVFSRKTGHAVTDAHVSLRLQALSANGAPKGAADDVSVVAMQAIGKGPASTHYGNNVHLAYGHYRVTATVNGKPARFTFKD